MIVWVLPFMKPGWIVDTWASLEPDIRARTVLVDNSVDGVELDGSLRYVRTGTNLGCAAAWNVGAAVAESVGASHLSILSEAVTFLDGGRMWERLLEAEPVGLVAMHIWHLVGFSLGTLDTVGPFDAGFWPIYYEDTDFGYRMRLEGLECAHSETVESTYHDKGHGRTWSEGWVAVDYGQQGRRYAAKWGGPPGEERFVDPWGFDLDSGRAR